MCNIDLYLSKKDGDAGQRPKHRDDTQVTR